MSAVVKMNNSILLCPMFHVGSEFDHNLIITCVKAESKYRKEASIPDRSS